MENIQDDLKNMREVLEFRSGGELDFDTARLLPSIPLNIRITSLHANLDHEQLKNMDLTLYHFKKKGSTSDKYDFVLIFNQGQVFGLFKITHSEASLGPSVYEAMKEGSGEQ